MKNIDELLRKQNTCIIDDNDMHWCLGSALGKALQYQDTQQFISQHVPDKNAKIFKQI